MPPLRKTKPKPKTDIKDLAAQGAKEIIEFFLGDPIVKKAYIKVLHDAGMSYRDIQKVAKTSSATISEVISGKDETVNDGMVETLKKIELNRLHMIGGKILQVMADPGKIEGMKGGDLAYAYKTFLEARRLLENKSTANISVLIETFTKKVSDEGRKIDEMMKRMSQDNPQLIEAKAEGSDAQLQHAG